MEALVEVFEVFKRTCYVLLRRHSKEEISAHISPKVESPELKEKVPQADRKSHKTSNSQKDKPLIKRDASTRVRKVKDSLQTLLKTRKNSKKIKSKKEKNTDTQSRKHKKINITKHVATSLGKEDRVKFEENKVLENLLEKVVGGKVAKSPKSNGETKPQNSQAEEVQDAALCKTKVSHLKGVKKQRHKQVKAGVNESKENILLKANECLEDICKKVILNLRVDKSRTIPVNDPNPLQKLKKRTIDKHCKSDADIHAKPEGPRLRNLPKVDFNFDKLRKSKQKFRKKNFIKTSKEMADVGATSKIKGESTKSERKRRKRKIRYGEDKEWKSLQPIDLIKTKVLKVNTRRKRIESSSSDGEDIEESSLKIPGIENGTKKREDDTYVLCKIMQEMQDFYSKRATRKITKTRVLQNGVVKTRPKKQREVNSDADGATPLSCIQQVVQSMVDTVCSFERKRQVVIDDYRKKKCKWCDIKFTPSCGNEYLCRVCQDVARISTQKTAAIKKRKQLQRKAISVAVANADAVVVPAPRGRPPKKNNAKKKALENLEKTIPPSANLENLAITRKYSPRKRKISTPEVTSHLVPSVEQVVNAPLDVEKPEEIKEKERKPKRKKKENEKKLVLTIGNKKVFKRMYVHSPCEVEDKKLKRKSAEQSENSRKKSKRSSVTAVEKSQLQPKDSEPCVSFKDVPNKKTLDSIPSEIQNNLSISTVTENQMDSVRPQPFEPINDYFETPVSSVIVSNYSNNVSQNENSYLQGIYFQNKLSETNDTSMTDINEMDDDESSLRNNFASNDSISFNQFTTSDFNDLPNDLTNDQLASDDQNCEEMMPGFNFSKPSFSIDSNVAKIFSSPYLTIEPSHHKSPKLKSKNDTKKLSFNPELQINPVATKYSGESSETFSGSKEIKDSFPSDDNTNTQDSFASSAENQETFLSPRNSPTDSSANKSSSKVRDYVPKTVVRFSGVIKKHETKPKFNKCVPTNVIAKHRDAVKEKNTLDELCDMDLLRATGKISAVSVLCSDLDAIGILGVTDLANNPKGYLQFLIESNKSEYDKLRFAKLHTTETKSKLEQCVDNRTTLLLARSLLGRYGSFTKLSDSTLRLANFIKIKKEKIEENEKQRSSCLFSQTQNTEPSFTEIQPSFSAIEPSFSEIEPSFSAIQPSFNELEPSINVDSMLQYCKENFLQTQAPQPVGPSVSTMEKINIKMENNSSCSMTNPSQSVANPIENIQAQINAMPGNVTTTDDQWGGVHHFQVPSETASYTDMSAAPRAELSNVSRDTPSRGSGPVTPGRPESAMSHVDENMLTPLQIKKERMESLNTLLSTQCAYSQNTSSAPQATKEPSPTLSDMFSPINAPMTPMNSQLVPVSNQLTPMNSQLVPVNNQLTPMNSQLVPVNNQLTPMNSQLVPVNSQFDNQMSNQRYQNVTPEVSVSNHYSHVISPIYSQNTPSQSPSTFLAPLNPTMNDTSSNSSQLIRALTAQSFQNIPPNVTIRNNNNNAHNVMNLQNPRGAAAAPNVTVAMNSDSSYSNMFLSIASKQPSNIMRLNTAASQNQTSNVVVRNGQMYNVQRLYFPGMRQGQVHNHPPQSETQSMNMSQFNNFKQPATRYMTEMNHPSPQNSYAGMQMANNNNNMNNLQQVVQHITETSYQTQRNSQVIMQNTPAIPSAAIPTSCVVCNKPATLRCKQCDKVGFCNATCGKTYWHTTHKMECCKT